ncbi:MAG: type II secretion system inner membrane protein GspF [Sandaracinaceae bacterium]|nr:type II secretion system inner membrane protein GspF [Sandaracinaceae bacterium]MDW8245412.1 type II secretion system inner membrane protein GspF [Sandaracinaceae bacterium]
MAVFEWRGINAHGKEIRGVRDADSLKALRAVLRKEGILLTQAIESSSTTKAKGKEIDLGKLFRRVSTLELAVATRQFATLLKSGVPLVETMTALIEQMENQELIRAFTQTRDKVKEGMSLHQALRMHPSIFPPLYVNMVEAGEASGTLEVVLARLADFLEAQAKLQGKVISALVYPIVMAAMGVLTVSIMMLTVVPKVSAIFEDFKQALPWYTRLLIGVSQFVSGYWWLILILVIGGVVAFRKWKRTPQGKARWDAFVLRSPVFGKLVLMVAMSRFARTLSTLLRSGVPLLRALEITKNIIGNHVLSQTIERASTSIREGEGIAAPLRRSGRFPPIVIHMIAVGERSGQLEDMLENVASNYDAQIESQVQAITSLLEPIMIVFMGGIAGFIAFSILMPLMKMNEFIQ